MLTRSKCMAAPEAAGEKNWEMERASDTFRPPTTVVVTPDPILAQSEPPPNPTTRYRILYRRSALKVFIACVTSFITRFLFKRTVKSVLYR